MFSICCQGRKLLLSAGFCREPGGMDRLQNLFDRRQRSAAKMSSCYSNERIIFLKKLPLVAMMNKFSIDCFPFENRLLHQICHPQYPSASNQTIFSALPGN